MTEEKDIEQEEQKVDEADVAQESQEEPAAEDDAGAEEEASEPDSSAEEQGEAPADQRPDADHGAKSHEPAGEAITPKMERKLRRSRQAKPALAQRSFGERAAERAERRAKKARLRRKSRERLREKRREGGDDAQRTQPADGVPRRAIQKQRQGVVVSNKADKTITVQIETRLPHPVYKKIVRRTNKLYAHDERNEAREGDTVRVVECRPLSRSKRWRLLEIVERAR